MTSGIDCEVFLTERRHGLTDTKKNVIIEFYFENVVLVFLRKLLKTNKILRVS